MTLLLLASGLLTLTGCTTLTASSAPPAITAGPGNTHIRERFVFHLKDLQAATGKRYRGKTVHIMPPVKGLYRDWRKMPVGKIRGRRQGGLTSWKVLSGSTTVYFAQWNGVVPDWLIRHEALHTILLSHGITGHPEEYAIHFGKPYWWLPEDFFIKRSQSRSRAGRAAAAPYESCPCCVTESL